MMLHFIGRHAAQLAVFGCLLGGANGAHAQSDTVSVSFMTGKAPMAPDAITTLGPSLFGDSVNLFNGSFSFEHTDFNLPGNSALSVALVRSHTPGRSWYIRGALADWDLNTPRIEGTFASNEGWVPSYGSAATRCSGFGELPAVARSFSIPLADYEKIISIDFFPWEYGNGINLVIPGAGSQEILRRNSANTLAPSDGNSYPLVTAKQWQIGCLPNIQNGTGQGFVALSPEGVRYRFDWMASRAVPFLAKSRALYGEQATLSRRDIFLMATQVTDRFGNWVKYTYNPAASLNLTRIESNDGRVATLNYSGDRLVSASDGTRTWTYNYDGNGDLSTVVLPDSSRWQFSLRSLVDPQSIVNDGYTDCDNTLMAGANNLVGVMTHPSGAVGTFSSAFLPHGRTNVTRACTNDPDLGANWTTGNMWPKTTLNQSLTTKEISGPGMPTMTWIYGGDENSPYGEWAPCNNCLDRKTVTVTDPGGAMTRRTFGIKWRVNEGQLLKVEEGWDGSSALKTTEYSYRDAAGQPYLDAWGDSTYFMTDYLASRNRPLDSRVIQQQGTTFSWVAAGGGTGFDSRARPLTVTKSSSLGYSRTETASYADNLGLWVLGQTAAVTEASTGKAIRASSYSSSTAMPTATSSFGLQTHTFAYYGDGTLQTLTDAGGHATTFQSFKRGKPQGAVFADSSTATAVVNNLGNVSSFTNEVSSNMSYGFDAMGRVSQINYPTGDPVTYNPTSQVFAQINSAEYGLPAGHWRQTLTTGNAITIRWFDALWRVRLERRYDANDPANTNRFTESRYDVGGRKVFESYPVRTFNAVDGSLGGIAFSYDALNRVVQQTADSELGPLTNGTAYLDGFQVRATNSRGYAATTAFQAFDEPSEGRPLQINAPEGVQVSFTRDVFGKTNTITRAGNGASVTRRYVYDGYERLCKTVEPEVGATVQDYDASGNLAWRASGLNLPDVSPGNCNRSDVPANKKISHGYDLRNRLTSTSYGDGSPGISRSYFVDGALQTINTTAGANWTYSYNKRRLLTNETLGYAGQSYVISRSYNAQGHLSTLGYPSGPLNYGLNALGEITQVPGYASNVSYHPNGAVAGYTLANGIVHSLTQNTRGLPLVNKDSGVMQDQYAYDANGNVSSITDQQEGAFSRSMGYDGLDRLTSASAPGVWGNASYGYDAIDNLRAAVVGSRVSTMQFDATNRLASVITNGSTTSYGYDAQGNLTSKGLQAFTFDIGNRMAAASIGGGYLYDGHGRRIRVVSGDGSTRMQFYSQEGQLLWSTSAGGPRATSNTAYIYLGGKQIAEWNSVSGVQYVHTDALGSPVAHTNGSAAVMNRARFEPYGYVAQGTKPSANTSIIGFTGHVQDAETDLVYMQQRYYDPIAGRFLSVDPIVTDANTGKGFGLYTYVENNPYAKIDPDGRESVGEIIDRNASAAAAAANSGETFGWAFAGVAWKYLGAEGVSQIADKGSAASTGDKISAGFEVMAAVVPGGKLIGEAGAATAKLTIGTAISATERATMGEVFKGTKALSEMSPAARDAAAKVFDQTASKEGQHELGKAFNEARAAFLRGKGSNPGANAVEFGKANNIPLPGKPKP